MTASTNGTLTLVAEIRQALASAEAAGNPVPGRPALARMTGASEHAVRRVLAELAEPGEQAGGQAATATTSTASPTGTESADQRQAAREPLTSGAAGNPAGVAGDIANNPGDTSAPGAHQNPPGRSPAGGRLVGWVGFVFGSLTSVAANVLAARIAPQHAAPGWHPSVYAEVGAAVWPVALLLSVEGLSRVRWPNSALWNLARYGGAGTVALGSALISYSHIAAVLAFWGYSTLAAHVGPLVVDGLMTVSGFALLATAGGRAGDLVTPAATRATSSATVGGERR
jgi:hypothetical protein